MPKYVQINRVRVRVNMLGFATFQKKIHGYLARTETDACSEPCQTAIMERYTL